MRTHIPGCQAHTHTHMCARTYAHPYLLKEVTTGVNPINRESVIEIRGCNIKSLMIQSTPLYFILYGTNDKASTI